MLSPVLFTILHYGPSSDTVLQIKFTDMSLSGFLQADEAVYTSVVDELVQWCDPNVLELNMTKTAELVIDFRRSKPSADPLIIKGQEVSIMPQYKYPS